MYPIKGPRALRSGGGNVGRYEKIVAYGSLVSPEFALLILTWMGSGMLLATEGRPDLIAFSLGITMALLAWVAANSFNHYFGVDEDRLNAPGRPIPSGRLSARQVRNFGILCVVIAMGISLWSPAVLVLEWGFFIPMGLLYYKVTKGRHIFGPLNIGSMAAVAAILGSIFVTNGVDLYVTILAEALLCFHVGFNIHSSLKDRRGDALHGYHTLPAVIGPIRSEVVALAFMNAAALTLGYYVAQGTLPLSTLLLLGVYSSVTVVTAGSVFRNPTGSSFFRTNKLLELDLIVLCLATLVRALSPLTLLFAAIVTSGQVFSSGAVRQALMTG